MPTLTNIRAVGDKKTGLVSVLVDTGATVSLIRADLAVELATLLPLPQELSFELADGSTMVVGHYVSLVLHVADREVLDTFLVLPASSGEQVILGEATMRKYGLTINYEQQRIYSLLTDSAPRLGALTTDTKKTDASVFSRKEQPMVENETLRRILARIGYHEIPQDLTDEDAFTMIVERCMRSYSIVASEPVLASLQLPKDATEAQVQGKILALTNRADVVPVSQFNEVKQQLLTRDKRDAVASALHAGKITPAERETWQAKLDTGEISLDTFKAFVAERPVIVPVNLNLPKAETPKGDGATMTPIDVNGIYRARQKAREARS